MTTDEVKPMVGVVTADVIARSPWQRLDARFYLDHCFHCGKKRKDHDADGFCGNRVVMFERTGTQFEHATQSNALRERAKQRPSNYEKLSSRRQWEIDKKLGILDWDGT